jgi:hypothetical protein
MTTSPHGRPGHWIRRKRRHYTTAVHYRFGHQVLLMLLPLAHTDLLGSVVLLIMKGQWRRWPSAAC